VLCLPNFAGVKSGAQQRSHPVPPCILFPLDLRTIHLMARRVIAPAALPVCTSMYTLHSNSRNKGEATMDRKDTGNKPDERKRKRRILLLYSLTGNDEQEQDMRQACMTRPTFLNTLSLLFSIVHHGAVVFILHLPSSFTVKPCLCITTLRD